MLASHSYVFSAYISVGTSAHLIPFTQYKAHEFTVLETLI